MVTMALHNAISVRHQNLAYNNPMLSTYPQQSNLHKLNLTHSKLPRRVVGRNNHLLYSCAILEILPSCNDCHIQQQKILVRIWSNSWCAWSYLERWCISKVATGWNAVHSRCSLVGLISGVHWGPAARIWKLPLLFNTTSPAIFPLHAAGDKLLCREWTS